MTDDRPVSFLEAAFGVCGFIALTLFFWALLNGLGWAAFIVGSLCIVFFAAVIFVLFILSLIVQFIVWAAKGLWQCLTTLSR